MPATTVAFAKTLTTITVKKGASTASITLNRDEHGIIYFALANGRKVKDDGGSDFARQLFAAANALV